MDMPTTSNVLQFFTADGSKVSVRPSGTEPKIKFYIEAKAPMASAAEYDAAEAAAKAKIAAIKSDLGI
jgi:phosphoglucomutase